MIRQADKLLQKRELSIQNILDYINGTLIPCLIKDHKECINVEEHLARFQLLKSLNFTQQKNDDDNEGNAHVSFATICQ